MTSSPETSDTPANLRIPRFLFRYLRDDSNLLASVSAPYLWFTDPASLNDPFDLTNVLECHGTAEEMLRYFRRTKGGAEIVRQVGEHEFLRIAGGAELPSALSCAAAGTHQVYLDGIGICCASFRFDSTLMWAHYSGAHAGACVALDTLSFFPRYSLIEVQYVSELPKWNLLKERLRHGDSVENHRRFDQIVLGTKYEDWAYEEEFRLISRVRGENPLEPAQVVGVILGARMSHERQGELRRALAAKLPHATVSAAQLDRRNGTVSVPGLKNTWISGVLSAWRLLTDPEGQLRSVDSVSSI